jgi:LacI family transcriptional regulator
MKAAKVTIVEVAVRAGVSTATASRVLGNYGYTGAATKTRVQDAASELGYRPNKLARGLITGRTCTIGVIAGDISSPFYAAVLRGISDGAEARGMGMLITNSDETVSREIAATKLLRESQVDGLIVSPCDVAGSAHLKEAVAAGMPMVLIDRKVKDLQIDSVAVENSQSSRNGVARLLQAGHRRIGIVAELGVSAGRDLMGFLAASCHDQPRDQTGVSTSWQRLGGYIAAHRDAGVAIDPALICRVGEHSATAAQASVSDLLGRNDRPTALFCADGLMSAGTMAAIVASGLSVPDDLSLVCFDDLDWMEFVGQGIDAIAQPRKRLGKAAAALLLARIMGAKGRVRNLRLQPRYISRGSVRPPRDSSGG